MKKIIVASILSFLFVALVSLPFGASAQAQTFNVSLGAGSSDHTEVIKLQQFLVSQGLLTIAPNGNYGPATQKAVLAFQTKQSIKSPNGYFGAMTRAAANKLNSAPSTVAVASNPAAVGIKSITNTSGNLAASALLAGSRSKVITWNASGYPTGSGVDINLLKRTSESPIAYELVRKIYHDTPNDGKETWTPQTGEVTANSYIEVTCSSTYKYVSECKVVNAPLKVN